MKNRQVKTDMMLGICFMVAASACGMNQVLRRAVENGAHRVVLRQLYAGANVQATDARGQTLLHLAVANELPPEEPTRYLQFQGIFEYHRYMPTRRAHNKRGKVIRMLLCKGADMTAVDQNGDTPLSVAAQQGYERMVLFLLDTGAKMGQ